ncbi:DoxX family protein [Tsukamurella serpentis]
MIRRIARPLLGSIFIYNGYTGLTGDPRARAEAVAPLVNKATDSLPESSMVPTDPGTWVRINSGVQLGGGLLLAVGRVPRVASLALAGTLVPGTVMDHAFWNETDPVRRREQQVEFVKNLSLLGGLLIAGFDTEGKPGVAWRARKAAEQASTKVSGAVAAIAPGDQDQTGWRDRAHAAQEAAQEYGHQAIDKVRPAVTDAVDKAKPVVSDAVDKVRPAVTDAVEKAKPVLSDAVDRARPVLADAADTASGLLSAAGEKLQDLRDEASGEAAGAARSVRRKAPVVAERARALGHAAVAEGKRVGIA